MQALRSLASQHALPRTQPLHLASCSRHFSSSSPRRGHYDTLGVPKDATKNQIKAGYYKLSKQFHPDINKDPGAKEKFQAVSDAYAVLGDERQRRTYDRSRSSPTHTTHHAHHHEPSHSHWSYEGRRRGATHAWEYARRPNSSHSYPPPPGASHYSYAHQHHAPGHNPFHDPHVQRATGRKGPLPTDRGPTRADHVARESVFVRTLIVTGLVLLIATIGHGFSASAA